MTVRECVEQYYEALRAGEPLGEYFADRPAVVKHGINERLVGYDVVVEGLADQTANTTDWTVTSHDLRCGQNGNTGWFADMVEMGWKDLERNTRYDFETRWSGSLLSSEGKWRFVGMHVSVPLAYADRGDCGHPDG